MTAVAQVRMWCGALVEDDIEAHAAHVAGCTACRAHAEANTDPED